MRAKIPKRALTALIAMVAFVLLAGCASAADNSQQAQVVLEKVVPVGNLEESAYCGDAVGVVIEDEQMVAKKQVAENMVAKKDEAVGVNLAQTAEHVIIDYSGVPRAPNIQIDIDKKQVASTMTTAPPFKIYEGTAVTMTNTMGEMGTCTARAYDYANGPPAGNINNDGQLVNT